MKKQTVFLLLLFSMLWIGTAAQAAIIVGRIGHVEGDIYRYMDVGNEWVETYVDSPVGTGDVLSTGSGSRAEINFPNQLMVRLDENAEVEIIDLTEDAGAFHLAAGLARFYNNSSSRTLKIRTTRGVANLPPGSIVDLYADSASTQIWSVRGGSTFLAQATGNRQETMEVIDPSSSLTILRNSVSASTGPIDRGWHNWCAAREIIWNDRQLVRSEYLPEPLQQHAYVLQPHGRWRRVHYRGYNYWAWKPYRVATGWSPYASGYWYDWHGDRVWIDHNSWGWVTHHHGHWMHVQGSWMWTPYVHVVATPGIRVSGLSVIFGSGYRSHWHPGRVRWIAHNDYVGWLPLAPRETYYGQRRWGTRSKLAFSNTGINIRININLADHHYRDHAVVVPRHHFMGSGPTIVKNYSTVKLKNINKKKIVINYKPLPTIKERKHKKREQIKRAYVQPRKRRVVSTAKKNRGRPLTVTSVSSKTTKRQQRTDTTISKKINISPKTDRRKTASNKKTTITQKNTVRGERVGFLIKEKGKKISERKNNQFEIKNKKERTTFQRQQLSRPKRGAERQPEQEFTKDRKHRQTDQKYAIQEKQKNKERYTYKRQQETRRQDGQKSAGHGERYSMNRSGFATFSSPARSSRRF